MQQHYMTMPAFASDEAMDELYIAQYLAMTSTNPNSLNNMSHNVTRIDIGRPAVPADSVVVSVDWGRRETSITYTYGYRDGQYILAPTPAISLSAQAQVPSAAAAHPTTGVAVGVPAPRPASTSVSAGPAGRIQPSSTADGSNQRVNSDASSTTSGPIERQRGFRHTHVDERPTGSHGPQPSQGQRSVQTEASTAGSVLSAVSVPQPAGASTTLGRQTSQVDTADATGLAATVKADKAKSQSKNRLNLRRRETKIPKTDHSTEWYSSWSRDPLAEPPNVRRSPGMLYVHRHKHETEAKWDVQMWMFTRGQGKEGGVRKGLFLLQSRDAGPDGEWVRIRTGQKHPELEGYVLHVRDTGEPSWVKTATARVYRARGQV